ncbi:MAG: hypothetical protein Kow0099_26580 [Candidatus Abyssubacteria bacterium]
MIAQLSRNKYAISISLFIASFILFFLNMDFRVVGDSLVYANIVMNRNFDYLTVHIGYYLIVYALHAPLSLIHPVPLDEFLVYLNVLFGALGIVVSFWLANKFLNSYGLSAYCAIILMFSGEYFLNSTSAEIYISQTFFVLLSFYLFMEVRPALSGICAVIALLISPLSVFSYAFFPLIFFVKKYEKKVLLIFSVIGVVLYGGFLLFIYQELLWGARGMLKNAAVDLFSPVEGLIGFAKHMVKDFGLVIPLFFAGCLYIRKKRELLGVMAVIFVPNFYLICQGLTGEGQTLPIDFFLCLLAALGILYMKSGRRLQYAPGLLVILFVLSSLYLHDMLSLRSGTEYKKELRHLHESLIKDKQAVVITSWWDSIAYKYYNRQRDDYPLERYEREDYPLEIDEIDEACFNQEHLKPNETERFDKYEKIYVLESYYPSRAAKLFLSHEKLMQKHEQYSLKAKVEKMLNVTCRKVYSGYEDFDVFEARRSG